MGRWKEDEEKEKQSTGTGIDGCPYEVVLTQLMLMTYMS